MGFKSVAVYGVNGDVQFCCHGPEVDLNDSLEFGLEILEELIQIDESNETDQYPLAQQQVAFAKRLKLSQDRHPGAFLVCICDSFQAAILMSCWNKLTRFFEGYLPSDPSLSNLLEVETMLQEVFQSPNFNVKNYHGKSNVEKEHRRSHDITISSLYNQSGHIQTHETIRNIVFSLKGEKSQIIDFGLLQNLQDSLQQFTYQDNPKNEVIDEVNKVFCMNLLIGNSQDRKYIEVKDFAKEKKDAANIGTANRPINESPSQRADGINHSTDQSSIEKQLMDSIISEKNLAKEGQNVPEKKTSSGIFGSLIKMFRTQKTEEKNIGFQEEQGKNEQSLDILNDFDSITFQSPTKSFSQEMQTNPEFLDFTRPANSANTLPVQKSNPFEDQEVAAIPNYLTSGKSSNFHGLFQAVNTTAISKASDSYNPFEVIEDETPRGSLDDFTIIFKEKMIIDGKGEKKLYGQMSIQADGLKESGNCLALIQLNDSWNTKDQVIHQITPKSKMNTRQINPLQFEVIVNQYGSPIPVLDYIVNSQIIETQKLPALVKQKYQNQRLKLVIFTNKIYEQRFYNCRLVVTCSKQLETNDLNSTIQPSLLIQNQAIWEIGLMKGDETLNLEITCSNASIDVLHMVFQCELETNYFGVVTSAVINSTHLDQGSHIEGNSKIRRHLEFKQDIKLM